jgi:UDP-N-acetylglucosamine 1-carboxyvinyltransferase
MANILTVNGGAPLVGDLEVRGAKNLVSKAMVAALLAEDRCRLRGVPEISDVKIVSGLLELHGVKIDSTDRDGELLLDPTNVEQAHVADIDAHAGSSRVPVLLCGPLLHRLGEAFIPDLGGCRIGERPINYHLDVLRHFGADVQKRPEGLRLTAPDGLSGARISLPYPSVETDRVIKIEGVERLGGYDHLAIPDRIEAGSWACAALATGGDIYVRGAQQQSMMPFLNVFRKLGGAFEIDDEGIRFWHPGGTLNSLVLETDVHPGFMTDWQQPLVVALTQTTGLSIVHETVYENRLGFTDALGEMGSVIQLYRECLGGSPCRFGRANFRHSAVISGPTPLKGAEITVPDLRGGFSYLIAALAAEGQSKVHGIELIYRGYERFSDKLDALGADYEVD